MNLRMVGKYIGYLILALAGFLLPSALVCLIYGEGSALLGFLYTIACCLVLGGGLLLVCRGPAVTIYAREGFVVAGGGWLIISILGGLPFFFSGEIPFFIDAFFESVSGFTTTGGSIINEVESMSRGLLFWRSFTNWLGGIGVLVFILGLIRSRHGAGYTFHLLRAETAGPQVGKLRAKTRDSVRILFMIYGWLSLLYLLLLLLAGTPLFDSLCLMFSTAGTGGFSVKNGSLNDYNTYVQVLSGIFMALFGVNFSLYFLLYRKDWRTVLKNSELHLYLGTLLGATLLIAFSLYWFSPFTLLQSLHQSGFTTSSIVTTTGYSLSNYDQWPGFSRALLLVLMLFGGMAGSTAGGFKIARILIIFKSIKAGLNNLLHPRSVKVVKVNGKSVDDTLVRSIMLFFSVYVAVCIISFLLLSFDGFSLETNLSAAISSLNNIGPGLGSIGPSNSFAAYSPFSKLVLIFNMLVGRLEIFPILLLFAPTTWKRKG